MAGIVMAMRTEQLGILISSTQIELKKQSFALFPSYIVISLCLYSSFIELTFISELYTCLSVKVKFWRVGKFWLQIIFQEERLNNKGHYSLEHKINFKTSWGRCPEKSYGKSAYINNCSRCEIYFLFQVFQFVF